MLRFFAARGVIMPASATACLSTPMTDSDLDLITVVFEEFLQSERAAFADLQ